jgi:kynurenine formamidase
MDAAARHSAADIAKALGAMRVVDLAPRVEMGIPNFPAHPPLTIEKARLKERDGYYCQLVSISEHTSCHVDAPAHFHPGKTTIDEVAAQHLIAPAVLYDFADRNLQPGDMLTRAMVEEYEREHDLRVGKGEIALINFGWIARYWRTDKDAQFYVLNQPGIDEDAVILFKERGVRAIGCDTAACEMPVVDGKGGDSPGHIRHWLPNGILIVEMLANLEKLSPRSLFVATPLKIKEGSGSPVRPIAYCES